MRVWLKFVVVWLVAVALPVQAVTSATMLHCGSSHQRMQMTQATPGQDASGGEHHGTDPTGSHQHHDTVTTAELDRPAVADADSTPSDQLTDLAKVKCSACASCCSVSAIPGTMPRVQAPEVSSAAIVADAPTVEAFSPDGPERPPRILLV
jgi:hypothetical protein